MARGWESKAVESQVEEREFRVTDSGAAPRDDSPEGRARRERLESLRLSRARITAQLERAASPAHRSMLERTLAALDSEIQSLS